MLPTFGFMILPPQGVLTNYYSTDHTVLGMAFDYAFQVIEYAGLDRYQPPFGLLSGIDLDFADGADWTQLQSTSIPTASQTLEWGPMIVDLVSEFNPDAPADVDPPVPLARPLLVWKHLYLPVVLQNTP